jgi:uncharacterized membrane protein (UPF0127 family)
MQLVRVFNQTRGVAVGEKIEVADSSFARMWGLLGRRGLGAGGGLWIRPSSGVHTVGMKFAIDVVGLDKEMRVVKIWHKLAPFRVTAVSLKIRSVLELAAGTIKERGIEVGDSLECSKVPAAAVPRCTCGTQKF